MKLPEDDSDGSAFTLLVKSLEGPYEFAFDKKAGRTANGPFVRFANSIIGAAGIRKANGKRHSQRVDLALHGQTSIVDLSFGAGR